MHFWVHYLSLTVPETENFINAKSAKRMTSGTLSRETELEIDCIALLQGIGDMHPRTARLPVLSRYLTSERIVGPSAVRLGRSRHFDPEPGCSTITTPADHPISSDPAHREKTLGFPATVFPSDA
jgi:hypothetical protein